MNAGNCNVKSTATYLEESDRKCNNNKLFTMRSASKRQRVRAIGWRHKSTRACSTLFLHISSTLWRFRGCRGMTNVAPTALSNKSQEEKVSTYFNMFQHVSAEVSELLHDHYELYAIWSLLVTCVDFKSLIQHRRTKNCTNDRHDPKVQLISWRCSCGKSCHWSGWSSGFETEFCNVWYMMIYVDSSVHAATVMKPYNIALACSRFPQMSSSLNRKIKSTLSLCPRDLF